MQRALILAWLALLAQVLPAISAPDEARSKAVVAYLRQRGIAASRLRPEGRSETVEVRILRRR